MNKYISLSFIRPAAFVLLAVILFAACGKDNEGPFKDPGTVKVDVTTGETDGDTKNVSITLTDANGNTVTIPAGEAIEVESGTYQVAAVNPGKGTATEEMKKLIVKGNQVSLTPGTDGELPSAPAFEAGVGTLTVSGNQVTQNKINLLPMSRGVELKVALAGADINDLQQITARIYGISASQTIGEGFSSKSMRAATEGYFVTATLSQASDGSWLVSTVRLLGVDTSQKQTLFLMGTLKDGKQKSLELDVTSLFKGFNTGVATEPLKLAATLEYQVGAGLTGSVTDWTPGWEIGN